MKLEEGEIKLDMSLSLEDMKEPRHSSKLVVLRDGKLSKQLLH